MQAWWNDILDCFLECNRRYAEVGLRPTNIVQLGAWDDPEAYDATYANVDTWGNRRWCTPGAIINGELVTTNLQQIDQGYEYEGFVEHSFDEEWTGNGQTFQTLPNSAPASPCHPWNKVTIPKPGARIFKEKYTWDSCPRWSCSGRCPSA